jgi:hypothetical protein
MVVYPGCQYIPLAAASKRRMTTPKFRLTKIRTMKLSRRDALAALAGLGAVGAGVTVGELATRDAPVADDAPLDADTDSQNDAVDADVLSTLVAAAEVLYPSEVGGHASFVETYVRGRARTTPDHYQGLVAAATELDAVARDWHADRFEALSRETRDRLLRELGADVADPDPDGNLSDRLRFYVVNDLLYALYTSPTGGRLVGTENPTGYPGGTASYQRGPEALDDD